jgi:hypothetical protein
MNILLTFEAFVDSVFSILCDLGLHMDLLMGKCVAFHQMYLQVIRGVQTSDLSNNTCRLQININPSTYVKEQFLSMQA